jgi:hypothetical protein
MGYDPNRYLYHHSETYTPNAELLQMAATAAKQCAQPGGMTEDERKAWCEEMQRQDRNGCHIDNMAVAEHMDPHTPESIVDVFLMWAHDAGEKRKY